MATITARKRKNGTMAYTAQIRLKIDGVTRSEARTFARRATAKAWAAEREDQLRRGVVPRTTATLGAVIEGYLASRAAVEPLGRTKLQHLTLLASLDIARVALDQLTAQRIIEHVIWRRAHGTGAATVANDLIWIRVALRHAKSALGLAVDLQALDDATDYCRAERLIARPQRRRRRPTADELRRIDAWGRAQWARERRNPGPPMHLILWLAIASCRRLDELCRMRISDDAGETWLIRDLKHPDGSKGRHRAMRVTPAMRRVVEAIRREVPRTDGEDRLLPYNPKSIGTYWQRMMKVLGIKDLHFHDLRREGASRLAEDGWTIPEIQRVTLHESWGSLQIYVDLPPVTGARVGFEDQTPWANTTIDGALGAE